MKILITGGAGYIGKMLVKRLSQKQNINTIFSLDKKPKPKDFNNLKINYLQFDLVRDAWEEAIPEIPDVIIDLAFDVRTPYGGLKDQEFNNLTAIERIFKYCSKRKIKKLIYFSSVSAYGARPENIGKLLKEEAQLTEETYPYGVQKKKAEEILKNEEIPTQISILRLASVNGPEGDKRKKIGLLGFIKHIFPILPIVNYCWARQYLHEKDIFRVVEFLLKRKTAEQIEVFNLAPDDFLTMSEIAALLNKKTIKFPAWFVKPIFLLVWHLSLGFIPVPGGSDKFFIYPVNIDGSKITKTGFSYKYNSKEAFLDKNAT